MTANYYPLASSPVSQPLNFHDELLWLWSDLGLARGRRCWAGRVEGGPTVSHTGATAGRVWRIDINIINNSSRHQNLNIDRKSLSANLKRNQLQLCMTSGSQINIDCSQVCQSIWQGPAPSVKVVATGLTEWEWDKLQTQKARKPPELEYKDL